MNAPGTQSASQLGRRDTLARLIQAARPLLQMYLLPLTISRRVHVSPVLHSELFLPTLGAQVLLDRGLGSYTDKQATN